MSRYLVTLRTSVEITDLTDKSVIGRNASDEAFYTDQEPESGKRIDAVAAAAAILRKEIRDGD